jgi:hypothetical protein
VKKAGQEIAVMREIVLMVVCMENVRMVYVIAHLDSLVINVI